MSPQEKPDKDEGLIRDRYELVIREIQTFLSIGYLLMVAIGMLFNYFKYDFFGINIFDYGGVFDFLIAPFAEIKILFFSLLCVVCAILAFQLDLFWEKKHPKSYKKAALGWNKYSWYRRYRFGVMGFLFLALIFNAAINHALASTAAIKKAPPITIKYVDSSSIQGILIGKTTEVLFLLDDQEVKVIPISSGIKEIKVAEMREEKENQVKVPKK